jgi:hypothetical protein
VKLKDNNYLAAEPEAESLAAFTTSKFASSELNRFIGVVPSLICFGVIGVQLILILFVRATLSGIVCTIGSLINIQFGGDETAEEVALADPSTVV